MRQQVKSLGKIWMDKYLSLPIPDPPDDDAPNVEAAANAVADAELEAIEVIVRKHFRNSESLEADVILGEVMEEIAARRNAR